MQPLRSNLTQPPRGMLRNQYLLIMRKHSVFTFLRSGRRKVKSQSSQPLSKPCTVVLSSGTQNCMNLKIFHLPVFPLVVYMAVLYKIERLTEQSTAKENETFGQMK